MDDSIFALSFPRRQNKMGSPSNGSQKTPLANEPLK